LNAANCRSPRADHRSVTRSPQAVILTC
jgi:hypothetical protein